MLPDAAVLCDPAARIVIAHRGGAARAPENTLTALAGARALGADAIEFDVRLSRDGEPVVIHDPTVDRTTEGSGAVAMMTAGELHALDAGYRFSADGGRTYPYRSRGIGVPSLAEVIAGVPDMPLLIEIKVPAALEPTLRLLERTGAAHRSVVAAEAQEGVLPARGRLRTGAAAADATALLVAWRAPRSLAYEALCIPPRYRGFPVPVGFLARRARRCGTATHVWTVNDPSAARRLWAKGVAGIVTDVPDLIAAARDR